MGGVSAGANKPGGQAQNMAMTVGAKMSPPDESNSKAIDKPKQGGKDGQSAAQDANIGGLAKIKDPN